MYPPGVANPEDGLTGSDQVLGQQFKTEESMNTTEGSDVDVTTEPSIQTDQQLLESLMARPEEQQEYSALPQEQGKAPGLSQLLIHGAPQAELDQAQYAHQMPATAGLDHQTDVGPSELPSSASGQQPLYPSQSSSAQETPQTIQRLAEQPAGSLHPELSAESRFESGFQDLGSLEAVMASTDRAEDSSKQGDTLLNRYLYPEKSASQDLAQADASRSGYIQPSKAQETLLLPAEQQAESHKPQIRVNLSEVLDHQLGQAPTGDSTVAASTDGNEMNFRYPELPQQQANIMRTEQSSSENKETTEVGPEMTTEPSQTSDRQPTNGVNEDSLQHWVDEFDNDQEQNDRDDYEEDEDGDDDDDGYRLSDDEYNDSYRDRDGDADDEYDEDNYDEDGDEEMDEEDNYINKGAVWGYKTNQAFLGAEYHDFDLHIGPMKDTALTNFRHEPVRLRQFSETNMSIIVFYTWLGVVSFMIIIAFVIVKHRQKLVNLVWQRANYRRHRGSRAVEEGHTLLLQPNV